MRRLFSLPSRAPELRRVKHYYVVKAHADLLFVVVQKVFVNLDCRRDIRIKSQVLLSRSGLLPLCSVLEKKQAHCWRRHSRQSKQPIRMGGTISTLVFQPPPATFLHNKKHFWLQTRNQIRIPVFHVDRR